MTTKLFRGELMTCRSCGKRQRSNPNIESGWTAIEIGTKPRQIIYLCPQCFNKITEGAKK